MPPKLTEAEGAIARIYAEQEEVNVSNHAFIWLCIYIALNRLRKVRDL